MNIEERVYELALTRRQLGTVPKSKEVYENYIGPRADSIAKSDEEANTVPVDDVKGVTGFHSDDNGVFIYDYMLRGFLKSAIETLQENDVIKPKIAAYKKWLDRLVFIKERRVYFENDGEIVSSPNGEETRPIRVMTPRGPRVSVVKSDYINEGAKLRFTVRLFKNSKNLSWDVIEDAFRYGAFVGLGQWRGSGGFGQFDFRRVD